MKEFPTETVYTASFGGDVKPSVSWFWLVLAFSIQQLVPDTSLATLLAVLM